MINNPGMDGNATPINNLVKQQLRTEVANEDKDLIEKEGLLKKKLNKLKKNDDSK